MLGRGEETSVGAPPTPPWVWACTMVPAGWVVLNVLLMGLATNPSANTTPELNKTRIVNPNADTCCFQGWYISSVITRFCFRLHLLLLLSDYWCLLYSLCGDWRRRVQALNSYLCRLYALRSNRGRLDPLGADLCRRKTNPIHSHQLHVV